MFVIYFLLPILCVLSAEFICDTKKKKRHVLKMSRFWCELISAEFFTIAMLILLFMDFGAFLSFSWLKLIAAGICSLFFVIIWIGVVKLKQSGSWKGALILCILAAFFLESTVFNFRFYQSHFYESVELTETCYVSSSFVASEEEGVYTVREGGSPYLEITDIDRKIHNIYVDVTAKNSKNVVVNAYVDTYITDESNENYFKLPVQTVMAEVEPTKYLFVLTNGMTEHIKLSFSSNYAETYQINGIYINVPQPMNFSLIRLMGVCIILFLFWLLRPKGRAFSYVFTDSSRQRAVTTAVIVLEVILLLSITLMNPAFSGNPSKHHAQYQQLAESFLDGQLYLEEEPPEFLAQMENPYDKNERAQQVQLHGESFYWDAAYFEGRYYVYFGVVPVLLLYLPYRSITGNPMPNIFGIQFFLCLFVLGSFLLIGKIFKKYFSQKQIPYLSYLILSLIFVNASGAIFIAKRPDFYSIPIISALAFTVFGLYFWMTAEEKGRVRPFVAGVGSLCMALVAGCRPQLLLVSAMIFVIYWNAVFKDRSLFSKKGWKSTLALILPYLIVAAGIMWYNYARFGSVFDFGANYNLTTNDMTGRGFRVERVGLAVFTYFFQFPNFTATFPFLQSSSVATNYLGTTITEPMFGGIFIVIPLVWCLFLLPTHWNSIRKKGLWAFCVIPLLLSLVIGVFDAQGAGLLQRYVSDFSFLACLGSIFMIGYLYGEKEGEESFGLHSFLRFSLYASGAYCFLIIFAKYSVEIFYRNPYLFNTVSELIQFW